MWRNCNPHALLKGIENGPAIMENSLEVPQKNKIKLPYNLVIHSLVYTQTKLNFKR